MADARVAASRLPGESAHPLAVGRSKARLSGQREARMRLLFRFQWSPLFLCWVLLCSLWRATRFTEADTTARQMADEALDGTLVSQTPDRERGIAEVAEDSGLTAENPLLSSSADKSILGLEASPDEPKTDQSVSYAIQTDAERREETLSPTSDYADERPASGDDTRFHIFGEGSPSRVPEDSPGAVFVSSNADAGEGGSAGDGGTPAHVPGNTPGVEEASLGPDETAEEAAIGDNTVDTENRSSFSDAGTLIQVPGVSSRAEGTSAPSTNYTRPISAPAKSMPIRVIEESSDDWSSEQDSESSASEESGDSESDDDFAIGDSDEDTNETKESEQNSSAAERDFFLSRTDERSRGLFEEPAPGQTENAKNADQRPRSPVAKARRRRAPRRGRRPKNRDKGRLHKSGKGPGKRKGGKGPGKRKGGKGPAKSSGTSPLTPRNAKASIPVQEVPRAEMSSTFQMLGFRGKRAGELFKAHRGLVWLANVVMLWALPTAVWNREQLQYMREGNPSPQESALINVTGVIAVLALGLLVNGYLENTDRFAVALNDSKLGLSKAERRMRKRKRVAVPVEEVEEAGDDQPQSAGATHQQSLVEKRS